MSISLANQKKERHVQVQDEADENYEQEQQNNLKKQKEEEELLANNSFESTNIENHLRTLQKSKITCKLPKASHLKFDTLYLEQENDANEDTFKDNLEEWYTHTKLNIKDGKEVQIEMSIQDIRNKNSQKLLVESMKDKFKSPSLDYNILDSILSNANPQDPPDYYKKLKVQETSHSTSQGSVPKFRGGSQVINQGNMCTSLTLLQMYNPNKIYTNPEMIKKENVKKIVNTIIQDKMEKIMVNPKEYFKKQQNKGENQDLDQVHTQTLKNFKNLKRYFNYGSKIDYDSLLNKIVLQKQLPKKLFNFTEEEINPVSTFKDVEPELLQRFLHINKAIAEKKQQQLSLRKEVAKQVETLNEHNIEVKFAENRLDTLASQLQTLEKQMRKQQAVQAASNVKNRSSILIRSSQEIHLLEIGRISHLQDEAKEEQERVSSNINELNEVCSLLKSSIDEIVEQIDNCDREIEQLKLSKSNLKTYLRNNYTKTLRKDLTTIDNSQKENISLVWAVKSMNLLNEDISRYSYPQYLDEKSQNFLQQAAVIEKEIDELKSQIKNTECQKILISQKKKEQYSKVMLNKNKNNTKEEISKKLKSIMAHNLQVRKPVFQVDGDSKNLEIQWMVDNMNDTRSPSLNQEDLEDVEMQLAVQERQRIIDQIQLKQNQYSELKKVELLRLISLNEKCEDTNLLKKFISLFGTVEGTEEYHNYINLNQSFLKKVENNKNFSSSYAKNRFKIRSQMKSQSTFTENSIDIKEDSNSSIVNQSMTNHSKHQLTSKDQTNKFISSIKEKQLNNSQMALNSLINLTEDPFDQFMKIQTNPNRLPSTKPSSSSQVKSYSNIRTTSSDSKEIYPSSQKTAQNSVLQTTHSAHFLRSNHKMLPNSQFAKPLLFSSTSSLSFQKY